MSHSGIVTLGIYTWTMSEIEWQGRVRAFRGLVGFVGIATGLGLALGLQVVSVAQACACGAFAPPVDTDGTIELNSEVAMVSYSSGKERIDMRLGVGSITKSAGLIVPTPNPPDVSMGAMTEFSALNKEMTPEQVHKDVWWSSDPYSDGAPGGTNNDDEPMPPVVLDQIQLGPIEATTLTASDAEGLTTWLNENKYGLSEDVTRLLDHYVQLNWAFVAMKLTIDNPINGDLAPIRFEFDSDKFVYPMVLSQAAQTTQQVTLYVFGDHRQDVTFVNGDPVNKTVTWARDVRNPALVKRGSYLTAISMTFENPSISITDDLLIVQAPTDDEVNTVVVTYAYMAVMGIPAGWLLVIAGGTVLGIVILISFLPRKGSL